MLMQGIFECTCKPAVRDLCRAHRLVVTTARGGWCQVNFKVLECLSTAVAAVAFCGLLEEVHGRCSTNHHNLMAPAMHIPLGAFSCGPLQDTLLATMHHAMIQSVFTVARHM